MNSSSLGPAVQGTLVEVRRRHETVGGQQHRQVLRGHDAVVVQDVASPANHVVDVLLAFVAVVGHLPHPQQATQTLDVGAQVVRRTTEGHPSLGHDRHLGRDTQGQG